MMLFILLTLVFIEIILIVTISYCYYQQKKPIARLNHFFKWEQQQQQKSEKKFIKTNFKGAFHVLGERMMKIFALNRYKEKMDKSLIRADIPLRAEEMLFIIFLFAFFAFFIGITLTGRISASILMGALAIILSRLIINSKGQKRLLVINEQLGDALDMLAGSLRAGHSLAQAMETVGNEMPLPISKEFSRAVKEMGLGLSIEKALENLLDRVPSDDLELLVTAIMIQRQIGGNLAEIIDNISGTIRQRIKLKGDVKTLTAQGRLSGWIIGLLPVIFVVILFFINPGYLKVLFTDRLGLTMVGMGIIGQVIGVIFIRKVIDIRY